MKDINQISGTIIGKAIEVHRILGPGLLESTYKNCLYYELQSSGIIIFKEKPLPIIYKEITIDHGYKIDLLVENQVVVELKTVEAFTEVHFAQLLTYMKLGKYNIGLLINFNVISLRKGGIKRFIL